MAVKIYVAGSKTLAGIVRTVQALLVSQGHEITFDWTAQPFAEDPTTGAQRARDEHYGIIDADAVVILQPGGFGTHIELGISLALGKRIVMVDMSGKWSNAKPDPYSSYRDPAGNLCAFFCLPTVVHVEAIEQIGGALA